ncbi:MAG TPA: hypothetical protein VMI54_08315 [Polyangiaceae bacterium]|nr:hypothetical protein [Polyangiaceae bacterium]
MEQHVRAAEYRRATNARARRWHVKNWLVGVAGVVLPLPAVLLLVLDDWRIVLLGFGIAACGFGFVWRHHLRVARAGLLPEFRNPGTLVCDEVGFRLIGVSHGLQMSWTEITSARLLLSTTDAVARGFVETIELTCLDGIVKIAWDASGRDRWLDLLGQHVPIAVTTISIGAWQHWH